VLGLGRGKEDPARVPSRSSGLPFLGGRAEKQAGASDQPPESMAPGRCGGCRIIKRIDQMISGVGASDLLSFRFWFVFQAFHLMDN